MSNNYNNNKRGRPSSSSQNLGVSRQQQQHELAPHPHHSRRPNPEQIHVKIVSARYGPCEGGKKTDNQNLHHHGGGGVVKDGTASSNCIPYTRDVTPFLRAILLARQRQEELEVNDTQVTASITTSGDVNNNNNDGCGGDTVQLSAEDGARLNAIERGGMMRRTQIRILGDTDNDDGVIRKTTMNAVFGDPCPGLTKRLQIEYIISDVLQAGAVSYSASSEHVSRDVHHHHHMNVAEHEKVVLRRGFVTTDDLVRGDDDEENELLLQKRLASVARINEAVDDRIRKDSSNENTVGGLPLRSADVSEIVLPITMPFLELRDRVRCRLVCRSWRNIVRDYGLATQIDSNNIGCGDSSFFTRPYFRGLMKHSYNCLRSLNLSGFSVLEKSDLHPSIPYLRKLRSLDVSQCIELDDSTLEILAEHVGGTLEVLYMKGLRKVTDAGLVLICRSLKRLSVLDVSYIPITDVAGTEIGKNLTMLRALYLRESYLLTNRSVDIITENCTQLEQLTLWGCIKIRHLRFPEHLGGSSQLTMLNLWGCHSLNDDAARALEGMNKLRSLVVSECHRLTDHFLLQHLYLRYCKRITDAGIHAIAHSMKDLYSLDLGFCTKVTANSICSLIQVRGNSLSELHLQRCSSLDFARDPYDPSVAMRGHNEFGGGVAGQMVLSALKSHGDECCLSVLDIQYCGGSREDEGYPDHDPFVRGMSELGFAQTFPGYFSRPARWNEKIQRRLVEQFVSESSKCPAAAAPGGRS